MPYLTSSITCYPIARLYVTGSLNVIMLNPDNRLIYCQKVFQWLIGATDGHAKNFSVFIQAGGSYRLTPFYDIISAFPVLGGTGIHISDLKLAMGLNASKGKKTAIDKIYPRHFLATAKVLRFPEVQMHEILSDFARMIPAALDNVKTSLPTDFPENVVTAVETNVLRLHGRLSREYGSK